MKNISKKIRNIIFAVIGALLNVTTFPTVAKASSLMASGALSARASDQPLNLFGVGGIFTTISNSAMFLAA